MSIIYELYRGLVEINKSISEINKSQHYHLIDKLIRFILTLSIFIATTKRAFSTIKHVKTMFRN
jgi:hypothetical protein